VLVKRLRAYDADQYFFAFLFICAGSITELKPLVEAVFQGNQFQAYAAMHLEHQHT